MLLLDGIFPSFQLHLLYPRTQTSIETNNSFEENGNKWKWWWKCSIDKKSKLIELAQKWYLAFTILNLVILFLLFTKKLKVAEYAGAKILQTNLYNSQFVLLSFLLNI